MRLETESPLFSQANALLYDALFNWAQLRASRNADVLAEDVNPGLGLAERTISTFAQAVRVLHAGFPRDLVLRTLLQGAQAAEAVVGDARVAVERGEAPPDWLESGVEAILEEFRRRQEEPEE